jgi:NAD-dependent dihydropyrimidine dehydrogenase PreA subunit
MPDNTVPGTVEQQQKYFFKWKKKLENIVQYVGAGKTGKIENTVFYNIIVAPFTSKLKRTTMKDLTHLSKTSELPLERLIQLTDKSFIADEKCNGCGICSRVCPVSNIIIIDKKPVWQNHCESCLACVNWCPQEAIQGGLSLTGKITVRYHHPDVKVADMLRRN